MPSTLTVRRINASPDMFKSRDQRSVNDKAFGACDVGWTFSSCPMNMHTRVYNHDSSSPLLLKLYIWFPSRKRQNQEQHALNGNTSGSSSVWIKLIRTGKDDVVEEIDYDGGYVSRLRKAICNQMHLTVPAHELLVYPVATQENSAELNPGDYVPMATSDNPLIVKWSPENNWNPPRRWRNKQAHILHGNILWDAFVAAVSEYIENNHSDMKNELTAALLTLIAKYRSNDKLGTPDSLYDEIKQNQITGHFSVINAIRKTIQGDESKRPRGAAEEAPGKRPRDPSKEDSNTAEEAQEEQSAKRNRTQFQGDEIDVEDVDKVWKHIQQFNPKVTSGVIHSKDDLKFPLKGRDVTVKAFVQALTNIKATVYDTYVSDRTKHPIPVFNGMPGLGKTRMLEEWRTIFDKVGIKGKRHNVLLSYGNGTSPIELDRKMPIEASFSWRMLHHLFLRDSGSKMNWHDQNFLPKNKNEMSIHVALKVMDKGIRELEGYGEDDQISLFIGIDEYQKIPKGKEATDDRNSWKLFELLEALVRTFENSPLHFYPALAGTQLSAISSLSGSSTMETIRIPLRFLTWSEIETSIMSHPTRKSTVFTSPLQRQQLFTLGGIPRPSIEFNGKNFAEVFEKRIEGPWGQHLDVLQLLRLIAFSVSGTEVGLNVDSGIIDNAQWKHLYDKGLCLVQNRKVLIPYSLIHLVKLAKSGKRNVTKTEECMLQNIDFLVKQVDDNLFSTAPWELWERFGAAFLALRINSLLLLNSDPERNFQEILDGAESNGCDVLVKLTPVKVVEIKETLSNKMTTKSFVFGVEHNDRLPCLHNPTSDEDNFVFLNGKSGKGVDIFTSFPKPHGNGIVLYLDQRKRVAKTMAQSAMDEILREMQAVAPQISAESVCVFGVCNMMSSVRADLPNNSFHLSFDILEKFYGSFVGHPACSPGINVNFANKSTLMLLKSIKAIVDAIVERRESKHFDNIDVFKEFCSTLNHRLSAKDEERVFVF
eukprot:m.328982 g.328982  ORF g.328982 m.328982 type:complete len:989 (+) comp16566_c0_seq26:227-3193(+)